jgi:hypothetical protein
MVYLDATWWVGGKFWRRRVVDRADAWDEIARCGWGSGVGAFGLPGILGIAVEAVLTIFLLFLLAAFFLFLAFLAAIAHGKKSSPE